MQIVWIIILIMTRNRQIRRRTRRNRFRVWIHHLEQESNNQEKRNDEMQKNRS